MNNLMMNNSKELIKNRMLKHAVTYWGIKNTEDLDPAVKLILEALSLELYNLGNETKDTQVRILEKVANLLAPDSLTSPNPAHAIMHASPVEASETLTKTTGFFAQRKISSRQNEELDTTLDIHFTPVDAVTLLNVHVTHIAAGGNLYSYGPAFNRQFVARMNTRPTDSRSIWLGLKINPLLESLEHLLFCFDWKNLESKLSHDIVQLLPMTKWYIDGEEVQTMPGVQYTQPSGLSDNDDNIFLDYDLLTLKEKDIKAFYDPSFITITESCSNLLRDCKETYPPVFETLFAKAQLQALQEKLLWIKVAFPPAMPQDWLSELNVYPNAFPVMNRKLIDLKYRLKGGSNIIPLRTEMLDQFLTVRSLTDETRQYRSVPYRDKEEELNGTYTLRNGGVERFDSRNAKELIGYLLELLRSESAAFSAYGYDFIATTLKELNQKISLMEQKTRGYINSSEETPNYIIVKPFEGQDMMYAQYWTTLAAMANNLRAGTKLQQARGVKVIPDSMSLITTSMGGKNRLQPEEKLNAFRYGLLTRNRIITKEDIRSFCYYELGGKISNIEIKKGYEMSFGSREGFRRTIDVILTPVDTGRIEADDWDLIRAQLTSKLKARSGITNNYRVLLKNTNELN
ncbi:MAG TPA: type VI secretion system baseplate subunit TssF [Flavitalea sp.]|nr:type VI secretion system baseplate subunit TssF [Flavitalea sp.]